MSVESARAETDRDVFVFDPLRYPALYTDVRRKRVIAYLMDLVFLCLIIVAAGALVAVFGVVTLGLGWLLFGILVPATALIYVGLTLGGPNAATPGMRVMGLELRLWYGAKPYLVLALMHGVLFYAFNVLLTPLIVAVSLFGSRKRLLHDILLGTVVLNAADPGAIDRAIAESARPAS
ncbi:MAG: RDD family protein [Pseudomonadota bacterium]